MTHLGVACLAAIMAVAGVVLGDDAAAPTAEAGGEGSPTAASWEIDLETYLYLIEGGSYLLPIVGADHGSLHLEGRFQYEDLRTVSVWAGWVVETGTTVQLEAVPMAGVVAGRTDGLAPGLELTLAWKSLELYSENEYVFDLESSENSFFYSWNELGWQVLPWLRLGVTAQLTRERSGDLEADRGLFIAAERGRAEIMVYGYEFGGDDAFAVVALAWSF